MKRLAVRLRSIVLNAAMQLMAPAVNTLASVLVISLSSEAVWGAFVFPMIFAGLALHILNWGNRDYLLRAFAQRPDRMVFTWRQALVSRGALLFIALPAVLLTEMSPHASAFLLLWIFAGFLRQSFEVVIVYRRVFGFAVLTDLLGGLTVAAVLLLRHADLSEEAVLMAFALGAAVRAAAVALRFGRELLAGPFPGLHFRYFYGALPFFLLGFLGLLVSRTDLYCVALFVKNDVLVGRYQVMISLLLYLQAVSGFVVLPFARALYRLPDRSIRKLSRRLLPLGLLTAGAGLPLVWVALTYVYGFEMPWQMYALGAVFVLPPFFYSPYFYLLFKRQAQDKVVLANLGGALVNLGGNLALIPVWGLTGALAGTVLAQVFTAGVVWWYGR